MPETSVPNQRLFRALLALLALAILAALQDSTLDLLVLLLLYAVALRLGRKTARWTLAAVALLLALLTLAAIAGAGLEYFFARPLELKHDIYLLPALWDLLEDTAGTGVAMAASLLGALVIAFLTVIYATLLRRSMRAFSDRVRLPGLALAAIGYISIVPAWSQSALLASGLMDAYRVSRGDDDFERDLTRARQELLTLPADLKRLQGQDVLLFFVESYGRLLWDDAQLRPRFQRALLRAEEGFDRAGYLVASRFLRSTTFGGASWLAHMSVMSGVRCDNPAHWERLLRSRVRPLPDYFRGRGYETVSVMPAMDISEWPEGDYFGFTRNVWARELDYQGPRYAWSPMPDQYVLLRLQDLVLRSTERPVFAEVSMTSSHSPFSQIPAFHDGDWNLAALNDTLATRPPRSSPRIWKTLTPEKYAAAVRYSLRSVARFVTEDYRRKGMIIILGDHQATKAVHRVDSKQLGHLWDVPMHVLTRDRQLYEELLSAGFSAGINPDEAQPVLPMENLKALLLRLFHAGGDVHP